MGVFVVAGLPFGVAVANSAQGFQLDNGMNSGDNHTTCLRFAGNVVDQAGTGAGDEVRRRPRFDTKVRMPSYTGAADGTNGSPTVVSYIQGLNPTGPPAVTSVSSTAAGGGFFNTAGGAACALPGFGGLAATQDTGERQKPPSWTVVVDDQFNGTELGPHWFKYRYGYRSSSGCPAPEHVTVSGGVLKLLAKYQHTRPAQVESCGHQAGWYVGGVRLVKTAPYIAVDQRVTVRWRVVPGGAQFHRIMPMRWPADLPNNTHGEEDWCEGHRNDGCLTFLHWLNPDGSVGTVRSELYQVDLTQWHTMTAEKRGYRMRFWIDGVLRFDYTSTELQLPSRPRVLVLQQECIRDSAGGCPTNQAATETIEVDWVRVENRRS